MSNQVNVVQAIQLLCTQIITNISLLQTTASVTDSSGYITDLYTNSGVISIPLLNTIGEKIENSRHYGNVDIVTTGGKILVKFLLKYSTSFAGSTKLTINTVDITNFYTIINSVSTGAVFGTNYTSSTASVLYPSPYTSSEYLTKLSTLSTNFKTTSNMLNLFGDGNNSTKVADGTLTTSQGISNTGGVITDSITVTENETINGNLIVNGTTEFSGSQNIANGIINEIQITTTNLTLSSTSGTNSKNSYICGVDTSGGVVTITLPGDSARVDGRTYHIFDAGGSAATNNITISGNGKNISGYGTSVAINTNYNSLTIVYSSTKTQWFII